ncbi:MAG: hypothetical protein Q9176_004922 [Flavoplaca citrina]
MHYIPIPKDDEMYNAEFSEDENIEKVSLNGTGFEFKCLSEYSATGITKAIFELEEDIYDGFKARITSSLSLMYAYTEPEYWLEECYANPRHYISIAKDANDTELPALEWDSERIEISVDWQQMFHKFFAEEDAYQRAVHDAGLKEIRCALSWPSDDEAGSEDDETEDDESEDDQSGGNENRNDGIRSDGSRDAPMTLEEYLDLGVVEDDGDSDDEMGSED